MVKNTSFRFWGRGDIEASIGLFFDSFSKIIISISLMLTVIKIPPEVVFGRIVPGIGLSLFCGSLWYVWEAYRLYKKENRSDITAQPFGSGLSTVWLFLIMIPVYSQTGDALLAWQVGLAATFIGAIVELLGALGSKYILKYLPEAALLGNMAAIAFVWLTVVSATFVFQSPLTGGITLVIILLFWICDLRLPFKLPVGLVAIIIGTLIAWSIGKMDIAAVKQGSQYFGFYTPKTAITDIFTGLKNVVPFLSIVIPLQIANFVSTLQALKSAQVAGDSYPVKTSMTADACWSFLGTFFGNPFPTTVYFGHPSWKKIEARAGYVFLAGLISLIVCLTGTVAVLDKIIPTEIIFAMMMFVGIIVSSQIFSHIEKQYYPVIFIAFVPITAQYVQMVLSESFRFFTNNTPPVDFNYFHQQTSIPIEGIATLGNGAFLSSLLIGAFFISVIDRSKIRVFLAGGLLTFSAMIGLIHAPEIRWLPMESQMWAIIYAATTLLALSLLFHERHSKENNT